MTENMEAKNVTQGAKIGLCSTSSNSSLPDLQTFNQNAADYALSKCYLLQQRNNTTSQAQTSEVKCYFVALYSDMH